MEKEVYINMGVIRVNRIILIDLDNCRVRRMSEGLEVIGWSG